VTVLSSMMEVSLETLVYDKNDINVKLAR